MVEKLCQTPYNSEVLNIKLDKLKLIQISASVSKSSSNQIPLIKSRLYVALENRLHCEATHERSTLAIYKQISISL